MDILKNLNSRLLICDGELCDGGEEQIKMLLDTAPIKLPEDYIAFLRNISGGDDVGISFQVDGNGKEIFIWNAELVLETREEFDYPFLKDFLETVCFIGSDLGDLVYFYGSGNDGFGIYCVGRGALGYEDAEKIAESLTDFLVEGVGIDVAV